MGEGDGGAENTGKFLWFTRQIHRTSRVVVSTAVIYYGERIQNKNSKEKGGVG